jgi:hypothetical protein
LIPFGLSLPVSCWPGDSFYFLYLPPPLHQVAGYVLAPSALWISIATVLTWTIWGINTPRQPLLPRKGDGKSAAFEMPLVAPGKWQSAGPPKKK